MPSFRRPRWFLLLGAACLALGCGDRRLHQLSRGISKDSVLALMEDQPERIEAYINNGQLIEALYFAKPDADSGYTPERELKPVVVIDGKVTAWGWDEWEQIAAKNNIQLKQ